MACYPQRGINRKPKKGIGFYFYGRASGSDHAQRAWLSAVQVKEILSDDGKRVIITYKINNKTQYKWEDLTYEMIGTDENGDLVLTEAGSEYSLIIQPKGEAYLTVMVEKNKNVYSWNVRITDMETSVF